jgi:hypothetical protein
MPARVTALALAAALCGSASAAEVQQLFGTWVLSSEASREATPACRSSRYDIDAEQIVMRSAGFRLTAKYIAEASGSGWVLKHSALQYNNETNCQGLAARFVAKHYVKNLEVDLVDGRLRVLLPDRRSGRYVEYVRAAP